MHTGSYSVSAYQRAGARYVLPRQICTTAFTDKDPEVPWALHVLFLTSSVASATPLAPPASPVS